MGCGASTAKGAAAITPTTTSQPQMQMAKPTNKNNPQIQKAVANASSPAVAGETKQMSNHELSSSGRTPGPMILIREPTLVTSPLKSVEKARTPALENIVSSDEEEESSTDKNKSSPSESDMAMAVVVEESRDPLSSSGAKSSSQEVHHDSHVNNEPEGEDGAKEDQKEPETSKENDHKPAEISHDDSTNVHKSKDHAENDKEEATELKLSSKFRKSLDQLANEVGVSLSQGNDSVNVPDSAVPEEHQVDYHQITQQHVSESVGEHVEEQAILTSSSGKKHTGSDPQLENAKEGVLQSHEAAQYNGSHADLVERKETSHSIKKGSNHELNQSQVKRSQTVLNEPQINHFDIPNDIKRSQTALNQSQHHHESHVEPGTTHHEFEKDVTKKITNSQTSLKNSQTHHETQADAGTSHHESVEKSDVPADVKKSQTALNQSQHHHESQIETRTSHTQLKESHAHHSSSSDVKKSHADLNETHAPAEVKKSQDALTDSVKRSQTALSKVRTENNEHKDIANENTSTLNQNHTEPVPNPELKGSQTALNQAHGHDQTKKSQQDLHDSKLDHAHDVKKSQHDLSETDPHMKKNVKNLHETSPEELPSETRKSHPDLKAVHETPLAHEHHEPSVHKSLHHLQDVKSSSVHQIAEPETKSEEPDRVQNAHSHLDHTLEPQHQAQESHVETSNAIDPQEIHTGNQSDPHEGHIHKSNHHIAEIVHSNEAHKIDATASELHHEASHKNDHVDDVQPEAHKSGSRTALQQEHVLSEQSPASKSRHGSQNLLHKSLPALNSNSEEKKSSLTALNSSLSGKSNVANTNDPSSDIALTKKQPSLPALASHSSIKAAKSLHDIIDSPTEALAQDIADKSIQEVQNEIKSSLPNLNHEHESPRKDETKTSQPALAKKLGSLHELKGSNTQLSSQPKLHSSSKEQLPQISNKTTSQSHSSLSPVSKDAHSHNIEGNTPSHDVVRGSEPKLHKSLDQLHQVEKTTSVAELKKSLPNLNGSQALKSKNSEPFITQSKDAIAKEHKQPSQPVLKSQPDISKAPEAVPTLDHHQGSH